MKDFMRVLAIALVTVFLAACASKGGQTVESAPAPAPKPAAAPAPAPADPCADLGSALQENTILFDYDKSDVKQQYRAVAQAHGQCLARKPSSRVTIEGFADERGTREYNLALGERRAKAIAEMVVAAGASVSQITTVSYGEERPVCTQSDESCWQRNRRGVFVYTAR